MSSVSLSSTTRRFALFLQLTVPIATATASAAVAPAGPEFQVNSYTTDQQRFAAVAMAGNGDFVVVWQSPQDESGYGVFAQRFSSTGARLGGEFQVNALTEGHQSYVDVAADSDGDFVVAWQSYEGSKENEVRARRFSSSGTALGDELMVNTYTFRHQMRPAVAVDGDGDFVVAWHSYPQDSGGYTGVFGQRFSSAGVSVDAEFQVNVYTTLSQAFPEVAMDVDGDFVVAWNSQTQDGDSQGIFARRFSSAGVGSAEFQVNTYTTNYQTYPAVGINDAGDFVVVWRDETLDGYGPGVFGQIFLSTGVTVGVEFRINANAAGNQDHQSIAVSASGDFVVAWSSGEIFARSFSSAGVPTSSDFQVNQYTLSFVGYPAVAAADGGGFVVAWHDEAQDGDNRGVFARLLASGATLDVDGDDSTEALTDGLLVLRRLFGFTGPALINGAVDLVNCTRCDATAIETHLAAINADLDIDGDSEREALTDGLLVLRWLFGFTDNTLTGGAVDLVNCTRCIALEIEPYLDNLD